jgi:hypothetical protein
LIDHIHLDSRAFKLKNTVSAIEAKELMKRDALLLAELIYDMFKEEEQRENDKIEDGQNNAQSTDTN